MKRALVLLCVLLAAPTFAQQFTPIAYWEFLHPEPQGNNLRAVKMIDSLTYIAVGDQGTVVRTSDDGQTWKVTAKAAGVTANLISIDFGSASTGAALAGTSLIFSNDTGKSWRRIDVSGVNTLYSIRYVTPSRAFVVGKDGSIAYSIDSGKTWKTVALESSDDLRDIHFYSIDKGITCGMNGVRFLSVDSGKTWGASIDNIGNGMFAVDFSDPTNGAICGDNGGIFLTKDGAKTWVQQKTYPNGSCNDVVMLSSQRIVVACDYRAIYMTTNGGTTWVNAQPFASTSLKSMSFASDKKNGVIVGANGIIMRTYNGATSWEVVFDRVVNDPAGLLSLQSIDDNTIVAGGMSGLIVRSTDGGAKWSDITNPTTSSLFGVDFPSPLIGTIVGDYGAIMRTRDGGKTWVVQQSNTSRNLRAVDFLDTARGLVCGSNGAILLTSNGGATWVNVTGSDDTTYYRSVAYSTESSMTICGTLLRGAFINEPVMIRSNNGIMWSKSPITTNGTTLNEGYALSFPTPEVGYASGSAGEGIARTGPVMRSLDSGKTWRYMDSSITHAVYGMSFINRHSGTAVGLDGKTSHTSDGGFSWREVLSGTSLTLNAVSHSSLQKAFAVGGKTAIIRLTTNDTIVTLSAPRTPVSKKHDILRSIYPNPVRELATFEIGIERTMAVSISLFDVKGNKVASIYDGILPNGVHEANLDVSKLTPGIYFARLDSQDGSEMMKVVVQ